MSDAISEFAEAPPQFWFERADCIKIKAQLSDAAHMQFSIVGVWKLYLSQPVQGLLVAISLISGFGLAYFGGANNPAILLQALIVAMTPIFLGILFPIGVSLLVFVLDKIEKKRSQPREVLVIPTYVAPLMMTPALITASVLLRLNFEPGYEVKWLGIIGSTIFVMAVYEAILRFIILSIVPGLFDDMSDEEFLLYSGRERAKLVAPNVDAKPTSADGEQQIEPLMAQLGDHALLRKDVLMLEAQGNYVNVVTTSRNLLVRGPLPNVLEDLRGLSGIQVHRSRWVAVHACKMLEKRGPNLFVNLINGESVKIVKARHKEVRDYFSDVPVMADQLAGAK